MTLIAAACFSGSTFAQNLKVGNKSDFTLTQNLNKDAAKCVKADFPCVQNKPGCNPALLRGIELTPEQQAQLDKLAEKEAKERAKVRDNAIKSRKDFMEKRDKEMKKVLTPTQYEQYKANKQALKDSKCDIKRHKHGKKSCNKNADKCAVKHQNGSKCCKQTCDKQTCCKQTCDKQKCDKKTCCKQKCDKQTCCKQTCDKQTCDKQKCDKK